VDQEKPRMVFEKIDPQPIKALFSKERQMKKTWKTILTFMVLSMGMFTADAQAEHWDDYPLQRSLWQRHYEAPWHYSHGQYVYYNPRLTASSAPYNFYEKPKVKKRSCCCTPQRKVRKYNRRVVYQPARYYSGHCSDNYYRARRYKTCCR